MQLLQSYNSFCWDSLYIIVCANTEYVNYVWDAGLRFMAFLCYLSMYIIYAIQNSGREL